MEPFQPTRMKIIRPTNPLRETVTADGPFSLEGMFAAGNAIVEDIKSVAAAVEADLASFIARGENPARHQRIVLASFGRPTATAPRVSNENIHSRWRNRSIRLDERSRLRFPQIMTEEKEARHGRL